MSAAVAYESTKRAHLGTEAACAREGILFTPLVVETTGAWAPGAKVVLRKIARAASARAGTSAAAELAAILQHTGVLLRRAQARSILRRSGNVAEDTAAARVRLAAKGAFGQ